MKKIWLFLLPVFAVSVTAVTAQDVNEALNLSNLTVQGTARSMGFGNTLGSVGGDFSSLSVNPAGLGIYRSSELSITPSLKINGADAQYQGTRTTDFNGKLNFNNFGIVFTNAPTGKRYERHSWKAVSFALGMNRVADFNHNYTYAGNNNTSSASLAFESSANYDSNAIRDPSTLAYMGYTTGLLGGFISGSYLSRVPFKGGIHQLNAVKERGSVNEYVISLGGNYKEKLMVGATIGIPMLKYSRTSDYTEELLSTNTAPNQYNFQSFTYNNTLNISGGGINLKLGAIYKLTDFFRIGAAIHTPTFYSITDVTDYGIATKINGSVYDVSTANDLPVFRFDYKFLSPLRTILSATFILKKIGFLTADYEYVDYNTMRFVYPAGLDGSVSYAYEAKQINDELKSIYKSASNLRLGAEIKVSKYVMVRGGVGYYGNPYKNADVPSERIDVSAGVGYRNRNFFADFAFINSHYQFSEMPYSNINFNYVNSTKEVDLPVANIKTTLNNAAFTVGVKF